MIKAASAVAIVFFAAATLLLGATFFAFAEFQLKHPHPLSTIPFILLILFVFSVLTHRRGRYSLNVLLMIGTAIVYAAILYLLPRL